MSRSGRIDRRSRKQRATRARRRLAVEPLEPRLPLAATPLGALPQDTAEFLLGEVDVTVVLMESSDQLSFLNNNSENWNQASIAAVKQKVQDGLQWWVDALEGMTDKHELKFNIDFTYADNPVETDYEPITRPSTNYQFWIYDFLNPQLQTKTGTFTTDVRAYNNQARESSNSHWGFTIFVVNDENDSNHQFASGGLPRAFAFPGGLFLVTLASRPASTITHETGHIFWALDEYRNGGMYDSSRGYYDTQNANAWDNPSGVRVPSIMDRGACEEGGGLLCDAYTSNPHTSSPSSLQMLGWRDSDGDGVFDVLDVPHTLTGHGEYDPGAGLYRFVGESSVQTLANLNPRETASATESMQSDITINTISRAEYRIDGGGWQTAANYGTYTAALDLSLAVPSTASTVEIRTIDAVTGVTSPVFQGTPARPSVSQMAGLNGFVFTDPNEDGQLQTGEAGLLGRTVRLVDQGGQPITLASTFDLESISPNAVVSNAVAGATITAIGSAVAQDQVYARAAGGGNVFSACTFVQNGSCSIYSNQWTSRSRQLRIDFDSPVTTVSLDAVSNAASEYGRLEIYDANDNLLARYTTDGLANTESETMTLNWPTADISYAVARSYADSSPLFDNLSFGPQATAITDVNGAYAIPHLPAGTYQVEVVAANGSQSTGSTLRTVTIGEGEAVQEDFGFVAMSNMWQNPANRLDVSSDGVISPIDVLQIVNDLNTNGSRLLTASDVAPPFLDVNGDGFVSAVDALIVINAIEDGIAEGEGAASNLARQDSNAVPTSDTLPFVSTRVAHVPSAESEGDSLVQPDSSISPTELVFADFSRIPASKPWAQAADSSADADDESSYLDLPSLFEDADDFWRS